VIVANLLAHAAREAHKVARGIGDEHFKFRRRLVTVVLLTLIADVIGTGLMYWLENGEQGSDITSVFIAFFWVTTQLLTVSSQMPNPVTTGGRIVDIFLQVWAITFVATVAGAFAAFLTRK
jgi:hypothetical protein